MPGMRLSWSIPQFAFLNTDITAYIDDSRGVNSGGAPTESNSYMVDVNWALSFSLSRNDFSSEGHIETIHSRCNEFRGDDNSHVLGQPPLRYDLESPFDTLGFYFPGWSINFGSDKDVHVVEALAVIRL